VRRLATIDGVGFGKEQIAIGVRLDRYDGAQRKRSDGCKRDRGRLHGNSSG
jgi:hypothetical protein